MEVWTCDPVSNRVLGRFFIHYEKCYCIVVMVFSCMTLQRCSLVVGLKFDQRIYRNVTESLDFMLAGGTVAAPPETYWVILFD